MESKEDFWAPWRVKPSLKDKAFDWALDRALRVFFMLDKIEAWWQRRWRKNAE